MTRPRRGHGERGQAAMVVAIGMVTLVAITGLALDGGMEAGAYRKAQNAADAGALAAARQIYNNAVASPQVASTTTSLTPVARTEVVHNGAQMAWVNGGGTIGSPTVSLGTQSVWVPTGGGMSAQTALAQLNGTAGSLLTPLNASLNLAGTQATATANNSGSTASSQIDLATSTAAGLTTYVNCYTASATYHSGSDTYGSASSCSNGNLSVGVSVGGSMLGAGGTNAKVDANNAPSAAPRMLGLNTTGSLTNPVTNLLGQVVSVSGTVGDSGSDLNWNVVNGLQAMGEVNATGVHAVVPGLTIDASQMFMQITAGVDSSGNPTLASTCTPTTITFTKSGNPSVSVGVDSSCGASNLNALNMATVSVPWSSPSPLTAANACSTNSGSGVRTCTVQSCFVRVTVSTTPYSTVLCLGQINLTFNAQQSSCCGTQQFTGAVSVAATVPQPTYFLRVLGWSQTNPTATATADVESVIDESSAAFAASPFAMPDMATNINGTTERLKPGSSYYLYGSSMGSNSPAPCMVSGWQGELSSSSNHRVNQTLTGVSGLGSPSAPQVYLYDGQYYLEPVFDPISCVVEYYGAFTAVSGHPNWYKLVNSLPAQHGFVVQATSQGGWLTYDEGAVSVKLVS